MPELLLIQMSGCPGAGKSTIAREIAQRKGAVVLDHDILKSALLEANLSWQSAGPTSYRVLQALAQSLLDQGVSVILDSPCYYQEILDYGLRMAKASGACYRYIECVTDDLKEIRRRLQSRPPLLSQCVELGTAPGAPKVETMSGEELFQEWIKNMKRPAHSYLKVDTSQPLKECLTKVFSFLDEYDCT